MMDKKYQSLFKSLNKSPTGKLLVEYCRELESKVYDSRQWEPGMTPETAILAAKPIRDIINNVTIQNETKDITNVSPCE